VCVCSVKYLRFLDYREILHHIFEPAQDVLAFEQIILFIRVYQYLQKKLKKNSKVRLFVYLYFAYSLNERCSWSVIRSTNIKPLGKIQANFPFI
jgi:hypothetical protein